MTIRAFPILSLLVPAALAVLAQEPAPLSTPPEVPNPVSPVSTDPPLVRVPGTSLRHVGEMQPLLYPSLARLCRVQGDVTVRLILGVGGIAFPVGDAEGPPLLREAGRDYVRSVRFDPVQVDGRTVRAVTTATVPFRLQGADAGVPVTGYLLKFGADSPEIGHVSGEVEAKIRAWLTGTGLADRAGLTADPAATLLVRAYLAKAVPGKPDVFLIVRFLRLEDQNVEESILVRDKRILSYNCWLNSGTADPAGDVIASLVQGLLDKIVRPWEKPAKVRDAEARLAAEMATGRPFKAQDFDFAKMRVQNQPPPPPYPPSAKIARIQGTVVVELIIDEQGLPILAHAIEGPPQLRATAESYAMAWQFEPAKLGGVPVRARFKLTMPFSLR
jgi:TonB family protein